MIDTPTENNCPFCEKRRKQNFMYCDHCMHPLWIPVKINFTGDSQTAGYAGYNNGLGCEIKNKGHFNEVCKQKGVKPLE